METLNCNGVSGRYITISRLKSTSNYDYTMCHVTILTNQCPTTVLTLPTIDPAFAYAPKEFIVGIDNLSEWWTSPAFDYQEVIECFRAQFWSFVDLDTSVPTTLVNSFI